MGACSRSLEPGGREARSWPAGWQRRPSRSPTTRRRHPPCDGRILGGVAGDPIDVLRSWAVQDSPAGAAVAALVARTDMEVGWLERAIYEDRTVVALYNPRTATAVVPADEAAAFASGFLPGDDAGLKAIVDSAVPERDEDFAEPVALAVVAVADALDGVTLSRDDLHQALRRR